MDKIGVCSVSFRDKSPCQILKAVKFAGLDCVEWGSDVHARYDDIAALEEIALLQKQMGITCCSYGTYYRIGTDAPQAILHYIQAAFRLDTNILRVWCGDKRPQDYTNEELKRIVDDSRQIAKIAEENNAIICLECHNGTVTETAESALALMLAVNSPAFRMYWQPLYFNTPEISKKYAQMLDPYTEHLHVYNWDSELNRYPLAQAVEQWCEYRNCFSGNHTMLLEFMPDERIESLADEAEALAGIAQQS